MRTIYETRPNLQVDIAPIDGSELEIAQVAAILYRGFLFGNEDKAGQPTPDPYFARPNKDEKSFVDADYSGVLGQHKLEGLGPDVRTSRVFKLFNKLASTAFAAGHTLSLAKIHACNDPSDMATTEIVGASWVKPVGIKDVTILEFTKVVTPAVVSAFGLKGALRYAYDATRHLPPAATDEAYISMIAVAPHKQGFGIGRKLIEKAVADANGAKVTLSTMNPQNASIYERMGFKPAHTTKANGIVTTHMMLHS